MNKRISIHGQRTTAFPRQLPQDPRFYTTKEVAEILRYSLATTKNLLRSGKLKHVKEGRLTRIPGAMLDQYIKDRELEQGFMAGSMER